MANINTKIILAHDTLANWQGSGRVLSAGEIALATTDNGVQVHMGDGKTFSAGTKALDLSGLTTYAVTTKLSDDTTVQAAVDALNTKVGTDSVATQITNAIGALDVTDTAETGKFVTQVTETDGKIAVTRAALLSSDVPTIPESKVDGLTTDLAKIDEKSEILIGTGTAEATHSDLAIHKVTPEQYAEALTAEIPASDLYIVETEDGHVDAFGQRIQNVADGTVSSDAATFGQLSALSSEVGSITTNALTSVTDTGTGVVTKIEKSGKDVSVTRTSLTGTVTVGTGFNAISSITLGDYGQVTSVAGFKAVQSVSLTKDTTVTDLQARYTLAVDGTDLTTTIDIPQDKVISAAYVVDVSAEYDTSTEPQTLSAFGVYYDGTKKATVLATDTTGLYNAIHQAWAGTAGGDGKYIRLTISNASLPVYIAVPKLVDTYVGGDTTTVSVSVDASTHTITASVIAASIDTTQLKDSAVTADKIAAGAVTPAKMSTDTFVFDCGDSEVAD